MAKEPATINILPPELFLNIFQLLDNFASVHALVRTSKIFYHTWLLNLASISDAVLSQVICHFKEACILVDVQERFSIHDEHRKESTAHDATILRTKRLLANERDVSMTCDWVDEDMSVAFREDSETYIHHPHPPHLTGTERQRIAHACYQIWIITSLQDAHIRDGPCTQPANLTILSLRTLKQLHKLINWVIASTRQGPGKEDEPNLLQLVPRRWGLEGSWIYAAEDIYSCYREKLQTGADHCSQPDAYFDMFTFIDDHFKNPKEVFHDEI